MYSDQINDILTTCMSNNEFVSELRTQLESTAGRFFSHQVFDNKCHQFALTAAHLGQ